MGRHLPWKRSEPELPAKTESPRGSKAKSPSVPLRPQRVAQSSSNRERTPSTSPPPEPPKEEFMIPSDDRYRMVEDEFLDIAQRFTTHLHRAEYVRLKARAASQNAATIREIERPVVGPPTRVAKRRREELQRVTKQRKLLGSLADDAGEGSSRMGSSLKGLLESPRKKARTIRSFTSAAPRTRAAAGFGAHRMVSPTQGRGRDVSMSRYPVSDLEAETEKATGALGASRARSASRSRTTTTVAVKFDTENKPQASKIHLSQAIGRSRSEPDLKNKSRSHNSDKGMPSDEDEDEDDPFGIKKRRIRREKSRDHLQKATKTPPPKSSTASNSMPSFL